MNETAGVIQGGWGFVVAAYTVVWGGLLVYATSLFLRRRRSARDAASNSDNRATKT